MLQIGDTIKCSNADEMVSLSTELAKEDIKTDFVYEKDGYTDKTIDRIFNSIFEILDTQ